MGEQIPDELPDGWKLIKGSEDDQPMAVRMISILTQDGIQVQFDLGFLAPVPEGMMLKGHGFKIPSGQFLDLAALFQEQAKMFINVIGER